MTRFAEIRTLHSLAWLNIAFHVAGLAFLVWGIRPGSFLTALSARIEYLTGSPWGWTWGWGVWMLCALALIAFCAALECHLPEPAGVARLAVMLAAAGAAVDLFCDTIQMCVLPLAASSGVGAKTLFRAAERMANAGGLIVANGLYSVGILLLSIALRACRPHAHGAIGLGFAVFWFGMLMVVAGFAAHPLLAAAASGLTIGLYCVWTIAITRALAQPRADR